LVEALRSKPEGRGLRSR